MGTEAEFESYLDKLNDSFDLEDAEREKVLSEFRQLANCERSAFLAAISNIPATNGELLFHVYDSLSSESDNWQDFFLSELKWLLSAAEKSTDPKPVFAGLDGFELLSQEDDTDFFKQLTKIIVERISNSRNVGIRRVAIWLLGNFCLFKK